MEGGEAREAAGSGAVPPVLPGENERRAGPQRPDHHLPQRSSWSIEMCIADSGNQWREKEVFLNFSCGKINAQERQTGKNTEFGVRRFGFPAYSTSGAREHLRASMFSFINGNMAPIHIRELG